jgi:hypothetical protein
MVATAQTLDRGSERGGPRPAGGGWERGKSANRERTLPQNRYLHALIRQAVKGGLATDDGRRLTEYEAKVALVTAWMIAKGQESDIVVFDGHPIQLRRSTTTFDKSEASEFAEFIHAECATRGISLPEKVG